MSNIYGKTYTCIKKLTFQFSPPQVPFISRQKSPHFFSKENFKHFSKTENNRFFYVSNTMTSYIYLKAHAIMSVIYNYIPPIIFIDKPL